MKIVLLCGYFEPENENEINRKTKTWIENAANTFQERIIKGVKTWQEVHVISAPFVGPWPKCYKDIYVQKFRSCDKIEYVQFNNIWGYRNLSRTHYLKKAVKRFLEKHLDDTYHFLVYSPHTPLLEAAVYAKKHKGAKICLIVPDLPEYMNFSKENRALYDFFKKIDIQRFSYLCKNVDSFVVLTKYMPDKLQIGERPFIVVEGSADLSVIKTQHPRGKHVAYAGKLLETFGVKRLVEAFMKISDQDACLDICGGGELVGYIRYCENQDPRIHYHGVISADDAQKFLRDADVLVNPRLNDDDYTKYSFPSKNVEYLLTGNAVIGYMLDGMPDIYRNFMIIPKDNTVEALFEAIQEAFTELSEKREKRASEALRYFSENLAPHQIGRRILSLNGGMGQNEGFRN